MTAETVQNVLILNNIVMAIVALIIVGTIIYIVKYHSVTKKIIQRLMEENSRLKGQTARLSDDITKEKKYE